MHIDPRLIAFAEMVIATEVKKLVKAGVIRRSDAEDTRAELLSILVRIWDLYTPERGSPEAFVNQIVTTRLISHVRAMHARKRGRAPRPLDGAASSLVARVAVGESQAQIHLRIDLEAAIATLPPHLREIVDVLRRENVSDAAKELQMARSTLRDACAGIKARFRDSGLEQYMP